MPETKRVADLMRQHLGEIALRPHRTAGPAVVDRHLAAACIDLQNRRASFRRLCLIETIEFLMPLPVWRLG